MEDLGVALFQETLMYVNMSGLKDVLLFLASLEWWIRRHSFFLFGDATWLKKTINQMWGIQSLPRICMILCMMRVIQNLSQMWFLKLPWSWSNKKWQKLTFFLGNSEMDEMACRWLLDTKYEPKGWDPSSNPNWANQSTVERLLGLREVSWLSTQVSCWEVDMTTGRCFPRCCHDTFATQHWRMLPTCGWQKKQQMFRCSIYFHPYVFNLFPSIRKSKPHVASREEMMAPLAGGFSIGGSTIPWWFFSHGKIYCLQNIYHCMFDSCETCSFPRPPGFYTCYLQPSHCNSHVEDLQGQIGPEVCCRVAMLKWLASSKHTCSIFFRPWNPIYCWTWPITLW